MDVLTYSDARAKLNGIIMERLVADHRPVVITRQDREAVVLVSLADWPGIEETAHLLSSSRNAARLHSAIEQLDAGGAPPNRRE